MTKLTNSLALEAAITALTNYEANFRYSEGEVEFTPDEVIEKIKGMIAQLAKKNSAPKKPSATQIANVVLVENLLAEMEAEKDYTVSDIIKTCPTFSALSNQKVSAIANAAKDSGKLTKTTVKGRSYFRLVDGE